MGLFLSMSGVIGASAGQVAEALGAYVAGRGGEFAPEPGATIEDDDVAVIAEHEGNATIVYPGAFMEEDEAAEYLSRTLGRPVFAFHIHDEDLWMYLLFDKGQEVDRFNVLPEYWGELDDEASASWRGDAAVVAGLVPGVLPAEIQRYLREWDDSVFEAQEPPKAYPGDEFAAGNCWQVVDFMGRLGLVYPIDTQGRIEGETYTFRVPGS